MNEQKTLLSENNNNNNNMRDYIHSPLSEEQITEREVKHLENELSSENPHLTNINTKTSGTHDSEIPENLSNRARFMTFFRKKLSLSSKCITIMNILLVLFILQGLFGLFSCKL